MHTVIDMIFRQYLHYMPHLQLQPHRWCNGRSGQIKDYEIGICCLLYKVNYNALRSALIIKDQ
jgi:hypothetical protein